LIKEAIRQGTLIFRKIRKEQSAKRAHPAEMAGSASNRGGIKLKKKKQEKGEHRGDVSEKKEKLLLRETGPLIRKETVRKGYFSKKPRERGVCGKEGGKHQTPDSTS